MKTKHLFWALAMPAFFAACSNEDIEIPSQEVSSVMNRPMAGQVDLAVGLGTVDSRLDSNFQFEAGKDELGACLMDQYTKDDGHNTVNGDDFTFVNYIQTNYRYTLGRDGYWTNSSLLATGNYFFYYPYSEKLNARKSFEKYLNARQVLASNTTAARRNLVNDNQMYAGHAFVTNQTEGDVTLLDGLTLQPVFAFPYFTLTNRDTEGVTIKKIALQYINDQKVWPLKAIIDPAAAVEGKTSYPVKYDADGRIDLAACPVAAVKYSNVWSSDQLDPNATISAKQIEVVFPKNTVAKAGQDVKTYMVIPSGDYSKDSGNEVQLLIYTTEGLITADLSEIHDNTKLSEQNNVTNSEAMDIVYGDVNLMAGGKYRSINISFDEMAIVCPQKLTVSSTEDLDMYIQWATNKNSSLEINAYTTGKQVELSKASCALLAGNKLVTLKINGDITIAADAPANAYELVTFTGKAQNGSTDGQTVYNKTNLNLSNDINYAVTGLSIVNEGTISMNKNVAYKYVNIENKGTINAAYTGNYSYTITTTGKFVNKGTLEFKSKYVTVNGVVENTGDVKVGANTNLTAAINNNKIYDANDNLTGDFGEMVVNGAWTASAACINYGKIENNGSISGQSKAENAARWSYVKGGITYDVNPTVENDGYILDIVNNGNVEMTANADYDTESVSGAKGFVNNTIRSTSIIASATETIYVNVDESKTVTDVQELISDAGAGLVRFNNTSTLTIDKVVTAIKDGKEVLGDNVLMVDAIEFNGNVTLSGNTSTLVMKANKVNLNNYKKLTLAAQAKMRFSSPSDKIVMNLGTGSEFDIRTNSQISVTSNKEVVIEGEGTVKNYGTISGQDQIVASVTWQGKPITQKVMINSGNASVTTAGEFVAVAKEAANSDEQVTITLEEDIDLSQYAWTPIVATEGIVIEGNGKVISGLNAPLLSKNDIKGSARIEISDITIMNSKFSSADGKGYIGAFAAQLGGYDEVNYPKIFLTNCKVVNCTYSKAKYMGGLVGHIGGHNVEVDNCIVEGCTFNSNYSEGTEFKGHCGALVGYSESATIKNSLVKNVTMTVKGPRGGLLVGTATASSVIEDNTVENSTLNKVKATEEANLLGEVSGATAVNTTLK